MFQSLHSIWKNLTKRSNRSLIQRKDSKSRTLGRSLRFENCEDRRMLAAFTVDSVLDNGDGAKTTLREAVDFVNFSNDLDNSVTFDPTSSARRKRLTSPGANSPSPNRSPSTPKGRASRSTLRGMTQRQCSTMATVRGCWLLTWNLIRSHVPLRLPV